MSDNNNELLQDVTSTLNQLKDDLDILQVDIWEVKKRQHVREVWSEEWHPDDDGDAKSHSKGKHSPTRTSHKRQRFRTSRNHPNTPGAGSYNPSYSFVHRSVPGVRIVPSTTKPRRTSEKINNPSEVFHQESITSAVVATRGTQAPSFSIAPPRMSHVPTAKKKQVLNEPDASPGFKYDPNYKAVQKNVPTFSFAAPKHTKTLEQFKQAQNREGDEGTNCDSSDDSSDQVVDLDAAFNAVLPRAKGGLMKPRKCTKSRREAEDNTLSILDVTSSLVATKPRIVGGYWGAPTGSKPMLPRNKPSKARLTPDTGAVSKHKEEISTAVEEGEVALDVLGDIEAVDGETLLDSKVNPNDTKVQTQSESIETQSELIDNDEKHVTEKGTTQDTSNCTNQKSNIVNSHSERTTVRDISSAQKTTTTQDNTHNFKTQTITKNTDQPCTPKDRQPFGRKLHSSKQLERHRRLCKLQQDALGPGAYGDPTGNAVRKASVSKFRRTTGALAWKSDKLHTTGTPTRLRKQTTQLISNVGPGQYDAHLALDRTKKRVTCFGSFERTTCKPKRVVVRTQRVRKIVKKSQANNAESKKAAIELASKLELSDSSSPSSCEENSSQYKTRQRQSKSNRNSQKYNEEKRDSETSSYFTHSQCDESESSWSDKEEVETWIKEQQNKRKKRVDKYNQLVAAVNANPDDPDDTESVYEEVEYVVGSNNDPNITCGPDLLPRSRIVQGMTATKGRVKGILAWNAPTHEVSVNGKAKQALLLHRKRKAIEQLGPKTTIDVKYNAIEKQAPRAIDLELALKAKQKQNQRNEEIRQKKLSVHDSIEKRLLSRLGIDESLFGNSNPENVDEFIGPQLHSEWTTSPTAGSKGRRVATFQYHPETSKHPASQRAKQLDHQERSKLGPGVYETQQHKKWVNEEFNQQTRVALSQYAKAKRDLLEADGEEQVEIASSRLQRAKSKLDAIRSQETMSRTKGREVVHVVSRNDVKVLEFDKPDGAFVGGLRLNDDLGPGYYTVPENVTRFGKEQSKTWLQFSKMSSRKVAEVDNVEHDADGDTLLLEPTVSPTRRKLPGAGAHTFAQAGVLGDERIPSKESEEQAVQLELQPNYTFGKFYEPGAKGGYIDFAKQQGRPETPPDLEFHFGGDEMLALSPQRGKSYLDKRVKGGVAFAKASVREISENSAKLDIATREKREDYHDAEYDTARADKLLRPKVRDIILDGGVLGGAEERFPSPTFDTVDGAFDAEYDVQRGEALTKRATGYAIGQGPSNRAAPDLSKQIGRGERYEELIASQDVTNSLLVPEKATLAPNDQYLRAKGGYVMEMSKTAPRWVEKDSTAQGGTLLDLDKVERGEPLMSRAQRVKSGVAWSKQVGRVDEYRDIHGGDITGGASVMHGEKYLSTFVNNQTGAVDFSKQSGRAEIDHNKNNPGLDVTLKLDTEKIVNAPSQIRRVTGGVIAQAADGPKTEYGVAIEQQGNVLVLNPKDDVLRTRIKAMGDMELRSGREDVVRDIIEAEMNPRGIAATMMASPPRPDIHKAFIALKTDVHGGDSVLKPKTRVSHSGVQSKLKAEQELEQRMRKLTVKEAKRKVDQIKVEQQKLRDRVTGIAAKRRAEKKKVKEQLERERLAALAARRQRKNPKGKARWVG